MSPTPTHSEFARFEDRVDESIEKQLARFEGKLDEVCKAVAQLMVFDERQLQHTARFQELAATVERHKELFESRAAGMAERFDTRQTALATRFDARITELEKQQQVLQRELHGYVQRYLGITAAASLLIGIAWTVGSKFIS